MPLHLANTHSNHWARDYYRRNKEERKIVHHCRYCNYETTGPKQNLKVHMWGCHTPENERPFKCPERDCCRGFAAKHSLQKHLLKVHGKNINLSISRNICLYIIKLGKFLPPSGKTKSRYNYYQKHPVIKAQDLPITFNDQSNGEKTIIDASNIKYDARKNYININSYTRDELGELRNKLQCT